MTTLLDSIEDKYAGDEENAGNDYGFIVFVSSSPECKKGMFPPIMTLSDYNIDRIGNTGLSRSRLSHILELDLTDNLLADWAEVLNLLDYFPSLEFLNLSNNLLADRLSLTEAQQSSRPRSLLRKLVLHGNKVDWPSLDALARGLPALEELHVSNNSLGNPDGSFGHGALRQLFLTCNRVTSFDAVCSQLGPRCPSLELLSLGENPLASVPASGSGLAKMTSLNLNTTKIAAWDDIDRLRQFPRLSELRIKNCPLLHEYTAHERRSLLVARLPNVLVLNGGDRIPDNEREDAERAFVRFHMKDDEAAKPGRYHELVAVHGRLDPLVNVDMEPDTHVKVKIVHKEDNVREEVVNLYQTVQQFKSLLHQWFKVAPQNMRLYYCDQVMVNLAGPEEMKWPQKALYTYNVQEGDFFILDEKAPLGKLKTGRSGNMNSNYNGSSPSPNHGGSRIAIQFAMSPRNGFGPFRMANKASPRSGTASVARNLFGQKSPDASQNEK